MRALLAALLMLTAGCQCMLERDVKVERHCPPSQCESSCKCQPTEQCTPVT